MAMNKTRIEWTDFTLNGYWGCSHGCTYCSARKIARRFGRSLAKRRGYSEDIGERMATFQPVYLPGQLTVGPVSSKFRSRNLNLRPGQAMIFCEEMGDIMGEWVPDNAIAMVQAEAIGHPHHVVQVLTKNPSRLANFNPWPDNCWVGASAPTSNMAYDAYAALRDVKAKVRFASAEPLLEEAINGGLLLSTIDWLIVGAQTPGRTMPDKSWVDRITVEADRQHVPIFQKNNLKPLLGEDLRQEWPTAVPNGGET